MKSQELITSFTSQAEAMGARVIPAARPDEIGAKLVEVLRPLGSKIALVDSPW